MKLQTYGVRCPTCGGKSSRVLEAREGCGYIRRRHLCLSSDCLAVEHRCGWRVVKGVRWTTYEFFSPRLGAVVVPRTRAIRVILAHVSRGTNATGSVRASSENRSGAY